jgi:anti-sigma regulatory factor (Ser/Thr protein kinase)
MTSRWIGPLGAVPGAPVGRLLERVTSDAFACREAAAAASGFTACALPPDGLAVHEGRRFTGTLLQDWALGQLVDDAELIVSELLSNALRHGLAGAAACSARTDAVWLGMLCRYGTVLLAVCDRSTDVPELREQDFAAQSGRGLHIVDCLSETWGWTTPDTDGKAVWAAVACPGAYGGRPGAVAAEGEAASRPPEPAAVLPAPGPVAAARCGVRR